MVNPSLYEKVPYDPFKDFTPIMVIGASPNVFVVPAQSKIQTMVELIAQAKANPGKMNWTSPGVGTTPQLAGELLKIKAGLDMQHIPYAGAGPANTAVLGGLVDFYVANYGSLTGLVERRQGAADRGDVEDSAGPICRMFRRSMKSASRTRNPTPSRACLPRRERRSRSSTGSRRKSARFSRSPR